MGAPFRADQAALLQAHQRRIYRPLIQQDSVAADLLDAARNPVTVEGAHGLERP